MPQPFELPPLPLFRIAGEALRNAFVERYDVPPSQYRLQRTKLSNTAAG